MTSGARNAVVFLFVLNLLLVGVSLLWTAHEVNAVASRFAAANAAAQARGVATARKICQTLHALDAQKPPAGGGDHPSRAYLKGLHDRLAQLSPDLGCAHVPGGTAAIPGTTPSAAPGSPGAGGASSHPGGGTVALPAPRPGSPVTVPGPAPSPVPPVTVTTTATVPGSRPPTPPPPSSPPPCVVQLLTIRLCLDGQS